MSKFVTQLRSFPEQAFETSVNYRVAEESLQSKTAFSNNRRTPSNGENINFLRNIPRSQHEQIKGSFSIGQFELTDRHMMPESVQTERNRHKTVYKCDHNSPPENFHKSVIGLSKVSSTANTVSSYRGSHHESINLEVPLREEVLKMQNIRLRD